MTRDDFRFLLGIIRGLNAVLKSQGTVLSLKWQTDALRECSEALGELVGELEKGEGHADYPKEERSVD